MGRLGITVSQPVKGTGVITRLYKDYAHCLEVLSRSRLAGSDRNYTQNQSDSATIDVEICPDYDQTTTFAEIHQTTSRPQLKTLEICCQLLRP